MKVICIGRNYADHAKELNNPLPSEPMIFMKPSTAILKSGHTLYYPEFTSNLHYELELVLKISKNGKYIQEQFASDYYQEVGLGIDLTARDLQDECKKKGHPWEIAKAFDNSAIIGDFKHKSDLPSMDNIHFSLKRNGDTVQDGHSADLIFSFDHLIAYASTFFTLQKGDLIFTGTPAGVGPVEIGDVLEGYMGDEKMLNCLVK